jgi:uncharacterized membrane protein YfcA
MDIMILLYIAVGFVAEMIDNSLGMAYGVSSNTFLLSLGFPPAIASACVHFSEMFVTLVAGISHFKLGNVDRKLFLNLLIPGILGGIIGAYILTSVEGKFIKPVISAYLVIMGVVILVRAFRKIKENQVHGRLFLIPVGAVGGFFDAIGGGGWGPIVTTTVMARGHDPRKTVGSVNAAEFFVTVAESVTFILAIGTTLFQNWQLILGLLIGGVVAAPLAAYICKKIPVRVLLVLVGVLIIGLSVRTIYQSWPDLVELWQNIFG